MFLYSIAGQFLLEESRLIEAAEMAKKAAELDHTEFDVVFNAAHMLRLVLLHCLTWFLSLLLEEKSLYSLCLHRVLFKAQQLFWIIQYC